MAKFNPRDHVDSLEYDFTEFGAGEGVVPEPSTGKVNQYFNEIKAIAKDVRGLQAQAKNFESIEELSDEEAMETLDSVEEVQSGASEFQLRMMEALAVLCGGEWVDNEDDEHKHVEGGTPSLEDLQKLPYRVLQAFNQWLMGEISPKRTTPGIKH